jgi:hypothetical protein
MERRTASGPEVYSENHLVKMAAVSAGKVNRGRAGNGVFKKTID